MNKTNNNHTVFIRNISFLLLSIIFLSCSTRQLWTKRMDNTIGLPSEQLAKLLVVYTIQVIYVDDIKMNSPYAHAWSEIYLTPGLHTIRCSFDTGKQNFSTGSIRSYSIDDKTIYFKAVASHKYGIYPNLSFDGNDWYPFVKDITDLKDDDYIKK